MGLNIGALIGELASARANVALAFAGHGDVAVAEAAHDALQAELEGRLGVIGQHLVTYGMPDDVRRAWFGTT